jgi:hypothetical protein
VRASEYLDGISLAMTIIAGALVLSAVAIGAVARGSRGASEPNARI